MAILPFSFGLLRREAEPEVDAISAALQRAQALMILAMEAGRDVPADLRAAVDKAAQQHREGTLAGAARDAFLDAYQQMRRLTADLSKRPRNRREYPFEDSLEDAELLLRYAAETGTAVPDDVDLGIISARTAVKSGEIDDAMRVTFYRSYGALAKLLGDVTAETIRSCSGAAPQRTLTWNRWFAIVLTALVAVISVMTFVGNSFSQRISNEIGVQNVAAALLRNSLSDSSIAANAPALINDPCSQITTISAANPAAKALGTDDIQNLQQFASINRELRSQAIKLNWLLSLSGQYVECDPFLMAESGVRFRRGCPVSAFDGPAIGNAMQLNPSLVNYPAEVLCKIKAYQLVRDYANNIQGDYQAAIGGFTSFALPILFALLGAFAYRLRLFSDTIRKRTYHPSFADSARTITAVIAGSIVGLFEPLQGTSLPPLGVAFLVGYGVELFFRFLDNLTNAFGAGAGSAKTPR